MQNRNSCHQDEDAKNSCLLATINFEIFNNDANSRWKNWVWIVNVVIEDTAVIDDKMILQM